MSAAGVTTEGSLIISSHECRKCVLTRLASEYIAGFCGRVEEGPAAPSLGAHAEVPHHEREEAYTRELLTKLSTIGPKGGPLLPFAGRGSGVEWVAFGKRLCGTPSAPTSYSQYDGDTPMGTVMLAGPAYTKKLGMDGEPMVYSIMVRTTLCLQSASGLFTKTNTATRLYIPLSCVKGEQRSRLRHPAQELCSGDSSSCTMGTSARWLEIQAQDRTCDSFVGRVITCLKPSTV